MVARLGEPLALLSTLGTGLVAGVFVAFSTFVMQGLARLPAAGGVAAMQAINAAAINRWFLGLLFGAAVTCLLVIAASWGAAGNRRAQLRIAAAVTYLLGVMAVTMLGNVPLNEALDRVTATTPEALSSWAHYLPRWQTLNHLRSASAIVSATLFLLA
ncbi:MAG: anthrone oxygenase family protein [Polyangiaceae bacterium]